MTSTQAAFSKFERVFLDIRQELLQHLTSQKIPIEATWWYRVNLGQSLSLGGCERGMSVIDTVEILEGRALTEEEYFKAAVLGMCVGLLQSYFLIAEDIMHSSTKRRDQICRHLQSKVGMIAINDAYMLEATVYRLLKPSEKPVWPLRVRLSQIGRNAPPSNGPIPLNLIQKVRLF